MIRNLIRSYARLRAQRKLEQIIADKQLIRDCIYDYEAKLRLLSANEAIARYELRCLP